MQTVRSCAAAFHENFDAIVVGSSLLAPCRGATQVEDEGARDAKLAGKCSGEVCAIFSFPLGVLIWQMTRVGFTWQLLGLTSPILSSLTFFISIYQIIYQDVAN